MTTLQFFRQLIGCLSLNHIRVCNQVYPDLDVRNIVEANNKEEIDNWCDFGVSYCQHKFTVRPFHCLGELMAACLFVSLSVCLSVCLSVSLFIS